ncbi:MAG: hypothetical protein HC812_15065 [Leptolyngbya sp. RL_3_1]|nr:hypothetical protein [Leptolyngbya sp. RL_3_1]
MTQTYPGAAGGLTTTDAIAKVVVQWVDANLTAPDRDTEVRLLGDRLQTLGMFPAARLTYLREKGDTTECLGLQVAIAEPEHIRVCLRLLYDRLLESPLEVRLQILLRAVRLQLQTRNGEDLLVLPNAIETLLPARQIFQARAEAYALQGGEYSPVEKTNLELLRYRLNLSQEEADYLANRALGPYMDRQAKLRKYREVLTAELDRGYPLSEATWAELRTLYQSLGLTPADVTAISEEHITRLQIEATQLQALEQSQLPEPAPPEEPEDAPALPVTAEMSPLMPLPDYRERYRQEFTERSPIPFTPANLTGAA